MLVDTGSALTLVREDLWRACTCSYLLPLEESERSLITANSTQLEVLGQVTSTIVIGGITISTPVLVTKGLRQPCILGDDFLCTNECSVDLVNMTLTILGKLIPLNVQKTHQTTVCHVSVQTSTVIPGQHQLQLPIHINVRQHDFQPDMSINIFEPSSLFIEHHGIISGSFCVSLHRRSNNCSSDEPV